jgi:hypothetical protein
MVGQILSIRLFGSVIALPSVAAGAVVSATAAPSRAAPPEEAQELAAAAAILASTAMDRLPASISNTQRDDFDHRFSIGKTGKINCVINRVGRKVRSRSEPPRLVARRRAK